MIGCGRARHSALGDRLAVGLGVAAVTHPVVGHVHERGDLPDPRVAFGLVAHEGVAVHVPDEGMSSTRPAPSLTRRRIASRDFRV